MPISEFITEEFQNLSQNSRGEASSGKWCEFCAACGNLILCFVSTENGWSAWIIGNRSPIKWHHGRELAVCSAGISSDMDQPGGHSQNCHPLKASNWPNHSHSWANSMVIKKPYYNMAIHGTMLLGEESAAQAKMWIKACLADMLQWKLICWQFGFLHESWGIS